MKKIIFLFSIIISNVIFAQSVKDLDMKNGFRHFKLGSTPNQIENIVKTESKNDQNPNVSVYTYIGKDIKTVLSVPVSDIRLTFFENKLCSIYVMFGEIDKEFTRDQYQSILLVLEKTYGRVWYKFINDTGSITNGAIWKGEKVQLELLRVNYSKEDLEFLEYDQKFGFILIYDKQMEKQMEKQRNLSEF